MSVGKLYNTIVSDGRGKEKTGTVCAEVTQALCWFISPSSLHYISFILQVYSVATIAGVPNGSKMTSLRITFFSSAAVTRILNIFGIILIMFHAMLLCQTH